MKPTDPKKETSSATWGGARHGAGRPRSGKKAVLIRISPNEQALLSALGGSRWVAKQLQALSQKNVYVFRHEPSVGWGFNIMTGDELCEQFEQNQLGQESDSELVVFSDRAEALDFVTGNKDKFSSSAQDWLTRLLND